MENQLILEDLKRQSHGICIVITSKEEAARLNITTAAYAKAIRELNQTGALKILIEPMGSFYIEVNMLA